MAANKETMAKIAAIETETPRAVLDTLMQHLGEIVARPDEMHKALAEAVRQYASQLRAQVPLWEESGSRGAKGTAAELTAVAQYAETLAEGIAKLGATPLPATPARPITEFPTKPCAATHDHISHTWVHGPHTAEAWCPGIPVPDGRPGSIANLDAFVAEAVARNGNAPLRDNECCENMIEDDEDPAPWCDGVMGVDHDEHPGSCKYKAHLRADHPVALGFASRMVAPVAGPGDLTLAYLSGATDELPTTPPRGQTFPGALTDDELSGLTMFKRLDAEAQRVTFAAREIGATMPEAQLPQAPTLGQAGTNIGDYDPAYVPPGATPLTYADLLTPVPAADLPAHLSHSQIGTIGDCGLKYRAQRVAQLPEIPQWANIGGTAFHAAVESIEREELATPGSAAGGRWDPEAMWKHFFEAEVRRVAESSPVPETRWRSSRKGAEGRTFWEVNGPLMLKRYLDARPADATITVDSGGTPAIEWELTAQVPSHYGPLPFAAKLDRVTVQHDADGASIVIRDYKTSYERPTDTTQLGDYAWTLILANANLHGATRILGSYFDARRGTWTEPVDLLAAHSFESFQYRVTSAHAQKLALTTGPTPARPSPFCGGCSVRYACPIMEAKR